MALTTPFAYPCALRMMKKAQETMGSGEMTTLTTPKVTGTAQPPHGANRTRAQLKKIPNVTCLYRHKANEGYYGLKKMDGKQKTQALGTTDRKIAERKLKDWLSNLDKIDSDASKTTLNALLDNFLTTRAGMSKSTIATERTIINTLREEWDYDLNIRIPEILPSMLDGWLAKQAHLKNSSYNRWTQFIHQLFELAVGDKIISESPFSKVKTTWKNPRKTASKRLVPTDDQFKAIIESIRNEKHNIHAEESANWVEFIGLAGLGQAELSALTWGDVDWNKLPIGELSCRRKKTGMIFNPPIYPELKPLLQKMFATVHIPAVVGHPFRFISDSHSNSKRTPVPIDIGP